MRGRRAPRWREAGGNEGALKDRPPPFLDLLLLPEYGSQAGGVVALCEAAHQLGTRWIGQQHRVLEWMQRKGAAGGGGVGS